jgi:hypothetical protein
MITPNFVSSAPIYYNSGSASTGNGAFVHQITTDGANWTAGPVLSGQQINQMYANLVVGSSGSAIFDRVRLLSTAIELEFIGDSLYDGGIVIIQGFPMVQSASGVQILAPSTSAAITPLYKVGPVRRNYLFSLPTPSKTSSALFCAPTSGAGLLNTAGGSSVQDSWACQIWTNTPHSTNTVFRLYIRQMLQFTVNPRNTSMIYGSLLHAPPLPNLDQERRLDSLQADTEEKIFTCPPTVDPMEQIAEILGERPGLRGRMASRGADYMRSPHGNLLGQLMRGALDVATGFMGAGTSQWALVDGGL